MTTPAQVIGYLNERRNATFKSTTSEHEKLINGRIADGHTFEDFKAVIDDRIAEWEGTDQEQYIRPSTLFRPSKFAGYLAAAKSRQSDRPRDSLHAALQKLGNAYDKKVTSEMVDVWRGLLVEFPVSQILNGLRDHAVDPERGRYWPKPADVIKQIQRKKELDRATQIDTPAPRKTLSERERALSAARACFARQLAPESPAVPVAQYQGEFDVDVVVAAAVAAFDRNEEARLIESRNGTAVMALHQKAHATLTEVFNDEWEKYA